MIKRSILVLGNNSLSNQAINALRYFNKYQVIPGVLRQNSEETQEFSAKDFSKIIYSKDWQDYLFVHKIDKIVVCEKDLVDETRLQIIEMAKACQPLSIQFVYITSRGIDNPKLWDRAPELKKDKALVDQLSALTRITVIKTDHIFDPDTSEGTFLTSLSVFPVVFDVKDVPLLRPLHVLDVVRDIVDVISKDSEYPFEEYSISSQNSVTIGDLQKNIRQSMGLGAPLSIRLPKTVAKMLCWVSGLMGSKHVNLRQFNKYFSEYVDQATYLVNSDQRFYANKSVLDRIQDKWIYWFARYSLSFMWIWSGLSAVFSDQIESMQLLNKVAQGLGSNLMLNALGAINLSLGALTLAMSEKHLKSLWFVQFWVVLIYTTCTMLYAIELINEPLAPITKNFALMALMLYLAKQEEKKQR